MVVIRGTSSDDSLNGKSGNDRLYGKSGNDNLVGAYGNDDLVGGVGNDYLNGAGVVYDSLGPQSFGQGEIDTLTGSTGMDTFPLWGGSGRAGINVYYVSDSTTAGLSDYALITDFNPSEDVIKLTSIAGFGLSVVVKYSLSASPSGLPKGTGLFIDKPGTEANELIAILQNVSPDSLSLTASYFSYYS